MVRLYEEFEAKLEALCQEHGVEINLWYSPSKIPQPQFMFEGVAVDADMLYDEEEFSLLFSPNTPWDKRRSKLDEKSKKKESPTKNIKS